MNQSRTARPVAGLVILVTQRDGDGFADTAIRTAKLLSVQP